MLNSATFTQFQSFVGLNKFDTKTIDVVALSPATRDAAMGSGQADFGDVFLRAEAVRFEQKGLEIDCLVFSHYGWAFIGHSFLIYNNTLKERPDIVRSFAAASVKGIEIVRNNPEETVDILMKQELWTEERDYQLWSTKNSNALLTTKNGEGNPTGLMSQLDWQESLNTLVQYGELKNLPDVDNLFINYFRPKH